jgi:transposase
MQTWQSVFLGVGELPREISAFELEASFTFSGAERRLIEQRRNPSLKLCLASQIGFLRVSDRLLVQCLHVDVAHGTVIGQCYGRHRHQEFLRFLGHLDAAYHQELDLHVILDNYGTHRHHRVEEWLAHHPRFVLHFTPTSSSWLNLVERWFRELTGKQIRRGIFRSVPELTHAIQQFIEVYNRDPKPFIWTASAKSTIEKVQRCKTAMA